MLFNPEDGQTWEQIAETVWRDLPPDVRAHYDAQLAATGQTRAELCREAQLGFGRRCWEAERDPESPFAKLLDRSKSPYGHDPLVRKDR
jgi:hypothetical protein